MTRGNTFITQIETKSQVRRTEMHNIITMYPTKNNIEVHPQQVSTTSIETINQQ